MERLPKDMGPVYGTHLFLFRDMEIDIVNVFANDRIAWNIFPRQDWPEAP